VRRRAKVFTAALSVVVAGERDGAKIDSNGRDAQMARTFCFGPGSGRGVRVPDTRGFLCGIPVVRPTSK
jgi:hypothetical protein